MAMMKRRIITDLEKLRRERGLTQGEIAAHLSVSQSHLSRIISGAVAPGNKLHFRIVRLLDGKSPKKADEWLERVRQAAGRSRAFRTLVNSALEMMKRH